MSPSAVKSCPMFPTNVHAGLIHLATECSRRYAPENSMVEWAAPSGGVFFNVAITVASQSVEKVETKAASDNHVIAYPGCLWAVLRSAAKSLSFSGLAGNPD